MGIYLLRVTPTDINPVEPLQVEFKILNTGTAPIEIPVSPFDPQANDESVATAEEGSLGIPARREFAYLKEREPKGDQSSPGQLS